MMNEKGDLYVCRIRLALYRITANLVVPGEYAWGRVRAVLLQKLCAPKEVPPGTRKASQREVIQFLENPLQVDYPASMNTDACLGFPVMAYQKWDIARGHCEAFFFRPSREFRVACPRAAMERLMDFVKKQRSVTVLAVPRPLTWQSLRLILRGPLMASDTRGFAFGLNLAHGRRDASRRRSTLCAVLIAIPPQRVGAGPPRLLMSKLRTRLSGVRRVANQLRPRRVPRPRAGMLLRRRRAKTRERRTPFMTERCRTRIRKRNRPRIKARKA